MKLNETAAIVRERDATRATLCATRRHRAALVSHSPWVAMTLTSCSVAANAAYVQEWRAWLHQSVQRRKWRKYSSNERV